MKQILLIASSARVRHTSGTTESWSKLAQAHTAGKHRALAFGPSTCVLTTKFYRQILQLEPKSMKSQGTVEGPARRDQETRHMLVKCPSVCQKVSPDFKTKAACDGPPLHLPMIPLSHGAGLCCTRVSPSPKVRGDFWIKVSGRFLL